MDVHHRVSAGMNSVSRGYCETYDPELPLGLPGEETFDRARWKCWAGLDDEGVLPGFLNFRPRRDEV